MSPKSTAGRDTDQGGRTRSGLIDIDRSGDFDDLLTVAQASRLLGHEKPGTLDTLIRAGQFIAPDEIEVLPSGRERGLYRRRRLWAFADNRPENRAGWPARANRVGTVTERLAYLFAVVHAPGSRPYSAAQVARWIKTEYPGPPISEVYIDKLLNGDREPTTRFLPGLACFFGVSPEFFLELDPTPVDGPWLDVLIRLRDDGSQEMLAAVSSLAPATVAAVQDIINSLLRAEGRDAFDPGLWDEAEAAPALIAAAGRLSISARASVAAIIGQLTTTAEARPESRRARTARPGQERPAV